jgi:hypothetical protein
VDCGIPVYQLNYRHSAMLYHLGIFSRVFCVLARAGRDQRDTAMAAARTTFTAAAMITRHSGTDPELERHFRGFTPVKWESQIGNYDKGRSESE